MTNKPIIYQTSDGEPVGVSSSEEVAQVGQMLALTLLNDCDDLDKIGHHLGAFADMCGQDYEATVILALQFTVHNVLNEIYKQRPDFKAFLAPQLAEQLEDFRAALPNLGTE